MTNWDSSGEGVHVVGPEMILLSTAALTLLSRRRTSKRRNLRLREFTQTYNETGLAQSKMWRPGTLCITIAANIAETAILGISACFPDSVIGFVADPKKADTVFIKYYIDFIKLRMQQVSHGTTQDNLSLEKLLRFAFIVPEAPFQRKIALILSAYDDLIENNLRRIKILEEMAQTLYQEWFVKFRFPGRQKVKMVDSPLGKIPEGWEVSTVDHYIEVVPRKNKIKTDEYLQEGVIPVIDQGKDFVAGYIDDSSLAYDGPLPIIVFGDHTCVLKWVDFRFAVGADGTQLIRPKYPERLPARFLFYILHFVPLEQFGYQRHFKYLKEAKIIIPPGILARKFEETVNSNTDRILNLKKQNLNLRRTRDLLLPKLFSGELDVSELDIKIPDQGSED